jgi:hypothetical protein
MKLCAAGRSFGPYLAIELLVPGGSLVALLLCLYRKYGRAPRFPGEGVTQNRCVFDPAAGSTDQP